jgi:hypothetical protein
MDISVEIYQKNDSKCSHQLENTLKNKDLEEKLYEKQNLS